MNGNPDPWSRKIHAGGTPPSPTLYRQRYIRTDVAFVPVSAPDENGYCGLGISNFAWRTMFESAKNCDL